MKKYLLGIFAVLLAIGFSAFTVKKDQKQTTSLNQLYYWYWDDIEEELGDPVVNQSQTTFNPGDQEDLEALIDVTCPNNGSTDCARGYETSTKPTNQMIIENPDHSVTFNP